VIREAKDVLAAAVETVSPGIAVARSKAAETREIMARVFPLVSLITNPGKFDDRKARLLRYADEEAGSIVERNVRGTRALPVLLRVWAETEDAADALFSAILPALPRKWVCGDFEGTVNIGVEEHSDYADNVSKLYCSVAEITFTVEVATEAVAVATIQVVESEPGRITTAPDAGE